MANIIETVRVHQQSALIALLNLKNAFGEVRNIFEKVLVYYHSPAKTQVLFSSLYNACHISIKIDHFLTPTIPAGRGVLHVFQSFRSICFPRKLQVTWMLCAQ